MSRQTNALSCQAWPFAVGFGLIPTYAGFRSPPIVSARCSEGMDRQDG
jgi:hypothetical protein